MGDVIVREATAEDVPQIKEVFKGFARFHESRDSSFNHVENCADLWGAYVTEHLKSDEAVVLAAEYEGRIVGYCVGLIQHKPLVYRETLYGYIDNLGVLDEYQRMGIGEQLYKQVREWFEARCIKRIELFAASRNERSTAFWRKMGFRTFMENMFSEI